MIALLEVAEWRAKRAARNTGIAMFAAILILFGVVFISIALWLLLAEMRTPTFAAFVIGLSYFGLGILILGILAIRKPRQLPPRMSSQVGVASLVEGFLIGMSAAQNRGQSRR